VAGAALPPNADVAAQFELLADILELEGADSFRVLAYRRAAQRIRETGTSIAQLALDGKAKALQGIGKTIEGKIVQIVEDGEVHADEAQAARAAGRRRVHAPAGAGTEDGAADLAELASPRWRASARPPSPSGCAHSGLGPKSEENVLRALDERKPAGAELTLLGQLSRLCWLRSRSSRIPRRSRSRGGKRPPSQGDRPRCGHHRYCP
jgi:DNA polymerase (family 10)